MKNQNSKIFNKGQNYYEISISHVMKISHKCNKTLKTFKKKSIKLRF